MMKEICAQCLQMHRDPVTGEETVVFSCFNQDQPLDHVDFGNLRARLSQNGVQEKLTKRGSTAASANSAPERAPRKRNCPRRTPAASQNRGATRGIVKEISLAPTDWIYSAGSPDIDSRFYSCECAFIRGSKRFLHSPVNSTASGEPPAGSRHRSGGRRPGTARHPEERLGQAMRTRLPSSSRANGRAHPRRTRRPPDRATP